MASRHSNISEIGHGDFKIFYPIKIYYIIDIMPLRLYLLCTMAIGATMTGPDCNAAPGGTGPTQEKSLEHKNQGLTQIDRNFFYGLPGKVFRIVLWAERFPGRWPRRKNEKKSRLFCNPNKIRQLRGCIGYIEGIKPLFEAVIDNAKNAALSDPDFLKSHPTSFRQYALKYRYLHLLNRSTILLLKIFSEN